MPDSPADTEWSADPTIMCGRDFCEHCGDCLYCYGGDECLDGQIHGSSIRYIEHREQLAAARAEEKQSK